MERELLLEIKEYIEKSESASMWEYSSNIVDDEILFADKKRMPELYGKILDLLD
jgi:hypothetical protein